MFSDGKKGFLYNLTGFNNTSELEQSDCPVEDPSKFHIGIGLLFVESDSNSGSKLSEILILDLKLSFASNHIYSKRYLIF